MPTRIIQGSNAPDAGGGSTWGMIGQGAQGLAALVGSALQAQAADKAAKAAAAPTGFGAGSAFGPSTPAVLIGVNQSPGSGNEVQPMDIPFTRQPWDQTHLQFSGGTAGPTVFSPTNWDPATGTDPRDNPLANVRTRPIPDMMQRAYPSFQRYGGL